MPSTTATRGTPTLTVQPPAITPPCQDCQCELQNLHQDQEAVATSSSVISGWLASLPGCWGSDTFSWALQWEAVTQRKRPVLELFKWVFSTNLMSKGGLNYLMTGVTLWRAFKSCPILRKDVFKHELVNFFYRLMMNGKTCCLILVNTTGSFLILSGN